jgi:hypothetical protein
MKSRPHTVEHLFPKFVAHHYYPLHPRYYGKSKEYSICWSKHIFYSLMITTSDSISAPCIEHAHVVRNLIRYHACVIYTLEVSMNMVT